jgi:hypothetical protein
MVPAIAFLKAQGCDQSGRMVADYLNFTPERWEECHDHMQWAFPTRTKSAFNPNAPVIPEDFAFNGDSEVVKTLTLLLVQYLSSLGIGCSHDPVMGYTFTYSAAWERGERPYWAHSRDHNMLRITRVLECLGIFGMIELQEDLHDFFVYTIAPTFSDTINAKTVAFWVAAKENKLHRLR